MSYAAKTSVTVTVDASGDGTGYTDVVNGAIVNAIYTKDDFANGVDFTITTETTGQSVWAENDVNASATRAPRQATHSTAGVAATYDGTRAVNDYVYAVNERIKVVVAQGGNATSGTFTFVLA